MNNTVRKSVDIPQDLLKKLQIRAVLEGVSIKSYLESLIIEAAKNNVSSEKNVNKFNK